MWVFVFRITASGKNRKRGAVTYRLNAFRRFSHSLAEFRRPLEALSIFSQLPLAAAAAPLIRSALVRCAAASVAVIIDIRQR